jgi:hypothetical protein
VRKAFDDDEIFISGKIDAPLLLFGLVLESPVKSGFSTQNALTGL